jgi:hypothetical protein
VAKPGTLRTYRRGMGRRHHSASFKRLHELEVEGESAATPAIALAEVVLFLLPIFAFVSTVTFVAYYLSR